MQQVDALVEHVASPLVKRNFQNVILFFGGVDGFFKA